MNPKNKTLTIADVEAALLMSYQVPVSNFRINELLEITTSHYLHAHKNIVLVHSSKINDESYPPELIRFPDSLTRVLSTNIDIFLVLLFFISLSL